MKIKQIKVQAGRTFNHPFENFSNLRSDIEYIADVEEGDNFDEVEKELRKRAEQSAENHKQVILKTLEHMEDIARTEAQIKDLEDRARDANKRLAEVKSDYQNRIENLSIEDDMPF